MRDVKLAIRYVGWVPGILLPPARVLACAVCVDGTKLDLGFLWSALFLMAVPFVLAGLVAGWIYHASRSGRRLALGGASRRRPLAWRALNQLRRAAAATGKESEQ